MRTRSAIGAVILAILSGVAIVRSAGQAPAVRTLDEKTLREYAVVYQWGSSGYVYLQLWNEFTGFDKPSDLVAFDESGTVRTLYPIDHDRFFAGPGVALSSSVESRIEFQRDTSGRIRSLTWQRDDAGARTAQRVDIETYQ